MLVNTDADSLHAIANAKVENFLTLAVTQCERFVLIVINQTAFFSHLLLGNIPRFIIHNEPKFLSVLPRSPCQN